MADSTADVVRRLASMLAEQPIGNGDPLADELLDSLAIEQLVSALEAEYRIEFSDDELVTENFADIETLAGIVDGKCAASR